MLPLLLLGLYLLLILAPRQAAEREALAAEASLSQILARSPLPVLVLPRGAPPVARPLEFPAQLSPEDREELERIAHSLAPDVRPGSTLPATARALGPTRFLLGHDRQARKVWEELLARGSAEEQQEARAGLALVALRAALRAESDGDRLFALDEGLDHCSSRSEGEAQLLSLRATRAALLHLSGEEAEARNLAETLDSPLRESVLAWMARP